MWESECGLGAGVISEGVFGGEDVSEGDVSKF